MKTLFFALIASLFLCPSLEAQTKTGASETQRIVLKFGRVSKNCGGFGICRFEIDITVGELIDVFNAFNHKGRVTLNISAQNMERNRKNFANNVLLIEEDFTVPAATARALGLSSYTIKKGKYPVVFDSGTNTYNCTFN
ncbi:hypothetical protein [Flavobacterium selenitireducens]|uniref:hypothetical protein n=1 Tax=Flavobacterium selenitireducens TaxID=2722704 RepID=UPI00168A5BEB|nr:hypothetical protein [Flavobacterium selenitireducens]MBD3582044.1 hypothetical protein [Flavobacterium selenitireducens]